MKKTKIVCTIGPSTTNLDTLVAMINEGMNVARLNFSHGEYAEHEERINLIKAAREKTNVPIAIMLDTKGPEIRTGTLKDGQKVDLKKNQTFILTTEDIVGDNSIVSISYKGLPEDLKKGDTVLIDDGLIELKVEKIEGNNIICTVENEGLLGEKKSINIPNVSTNLPGLTEKDKNDLIFGIEQGVDFVAASFVRRADDVIAIRRVLDSHGGAGIQIISKIESQEGVYNIKKILEVSDGIMVARGDLGVEVPAQDVPIIQKKIIQKCNRAAKPVITATQMLDSMIRNPRPTRAEVADVANAVFDGTDAVMLSGETAMGEYPVETVATMAEIVSVAEVADEFRVRSTLRKKEKGITNAVCDAAVSISVNLNAKAIIAATSGGLTARFISKYKPDAIILGTSFREQTIRQLSLSWGVYGVYVQQMTNSDALMRESLRSAVRGNWVKSGNRVVLAAGIPVGASNTTNMLRVMTVGDSVLHGHSGKDFGNITGIAHKVRLGSEEAAENFMEGDILVVPRLTKENMYLAELAGGIVLETDQEINEYLLKQLENTPFIADVEDAFEGIREGSIVTLDTKTGVIHQGLPNQE